MEGLLYSEVYLSCVIVIAILLVWFIRTAGNSTPERWIKYMLSAFLITFSANLLYALVSRFIPIGVLTLPICYTLKTVYHIGLIVGIFTWCGYADTEAGHQNYARRDKRNPHYIPFLIPIIFCLINLKTHWIFSIDSQLVYQRNTHFNLEMIYLIVGSSCLSISLILANRSEQEPHKLMHILVTSSFPVALLVAWLLSFAGEGIPIFCPAITIELLCLCLGNFNIRISVDKLTMVNNRNNLIGFINYKIKNHSGKLYLLMIDIDRFKSINDNYGHLVGDYALVRVSKALKAACAPFEKRPYISRFGGDEFIIVLEGNEIELNSLCDRINECVSKENEETDYDLCVSIGISEYDANMDYTEFIQSADKELYRIKDIKNSER